MQLERAPAPAGRAVGLVAPFPPRLGGVATFAEWLVEHGQRVGYRFETFDLARDQTGQAGEPFTYASLRHQAMLLVRFLRWLPGSPRVVHYCVASSRTGLARDLAYLAALSVARRRTIAHLHGDAAGAAYWRLAHRLARRLTSERVVPSLRSASVLGSIGVPSRRIVNPVRFEPGGERPDVRRSDLRLLFVGRYGEAKGCLDLIDALAAARVAPAADVHLTFAGREALRGEEQTLRERAAERGVEQFVEFAGLMSADRLRGLYEKADALCLPSRTEGLPMALLEAMAFGLPVIATDVGGVPELVEHGRTGMLVSPGDVDALARAIRSLADDAELRARLGRAARHRVHEVAAPERVIREWSALYEECLLA